MRSFLPLSSVSVASNWNTWGEEMCVDLWGERFRQALGGSGMVRLIAREYGPPEDLYDALSTENLQLFFEFMKNADLARSYLQLRGQLRGLRREYARVCSEVVNGFQREDAERAARKKVVLQSEVRCIYDIIRRRETELNEVEFLFDLRYVKLIHIMCT
jgi:hypothetical protein